MAMINRERAVDAVTEMLTKIFKEPGDAVSERMRFRARQIIRELSKQKLLAPEQSS